MWRRHWIGWGLIVLAAALIAYDVSGKDWLQLGERDGNCYASIDWVDFLMLDDRMYTHSYDGTTQADAAKQGAKIGEVNDMLDGHACTGHKNKSGDAAYLPVGTAIYAMEGYKPSYRVIAGGKVYEIHSNPQAKTIRDLFDIDGRIAKVSLESGIDGSPIGDFAPESSAVFAEELLPLKVVGYDAIYKKEKPEYGIFLRVHLKDGTSFRMVFYEKANAFTAGAYGTERLREVIVSERDRIKREAGM